MFILKHKKPFYICWMKILFLHNYVIIIIIRIIIIKSIIMIINLQKTPLGETGYLSIFWGHYLVSPAIHPGFADPLRSPPALNSTHTRLFIYLFFEYFGIQFFNSLARDLQDTIPRQRSRTLFLEISLNVIGILSMCLRSHTLITKRVICVGPI